MKKANNIPGGLLIIFEGLDGAGKTTQIALAAKNLTKAGYQVHVTRNLGGSPIGEALRDVLLSPVERPATANFYIGVAVQEALAEVIKAEKDKGSIILLDRGPMSLVAYQSFGEGVNEDLTWQYGDDGINKFKPDQILYLNLSIDTALSRSKIRQSQTKADYFESKSKDYFNQVSHMLDKGAKRYKATNVDADDSIELVHKQVMHEINCLIT